MRLSSGRLILPPGRGEDHHGGDHAGDHRYRIVADDPGLQPPKRAAAPQDGKTRVGLDVPGDLTVAGFDDAALATTIWPELTTVHQPISDMASAAVEILVRQIRARRAGEAGKPEHIVMDFSIIRRQSDAAPRVRPPVARVKHA